MRFFRGWGSGGRVRGLGRGVGVVVGVVRSGHQQLTDKFVREAECGGGGVWWEICWGMWWRVGRAYC